MSAALIVLCDICGHADRMHRGDEGCLGPGCDCAGGTAVDDLPRSEPASSEAPAPAAGSVPVAAAPGGTVEELLVEGKRSGVKRTAALAGKIELHLSTLRGWLAQEAGRAEARREVERLERELAAAKAKLTGKPASTAAAPRSSSFACPDCGQTFTTPQGRGSHRGRVHGYRRSA